jgi:hypothetical protein
MVQKQNREWEYSFMVKHLPNMSTTLGLILSTPKEILKRQYMDMVVCATHILSSLH